MACHSFAPKRTRPCCRTRQSSPNTTPSPFRLRVPPPAAPWSCRHSTCAPGRYPRRLCHTDKAETESHIEELPGRGHLSRPRIFGRSGGRRDVDEPVWRSRQDVGVRQTAHVVDRRVQVKVVVLEHAAARTVLESRVLTAVRQVFPQQGGAGGPPTARLLEVRRVRCVNLQVERCGERVAFWNAGKMRMQLILYLTSCWAMLVAGLPAAMTQW